MNKDICYVSAYFDIDRKSWNHFGRTFEEYLVTFEPFFDLFNKNICENDLMVLFIDKKYENEIKNRINDDVNIIIIPIDNEFMSNLPRWKTLDREREIMNNLDFQELLGIRKNYYPEHLHPEYTLITHSKIDFVSWLITNNIVDYEYYTWVDFGFFKLKENIPKKLLDINKLNIETVNFPLVNQLDMLDQDVIYTVQNAPEKIGGFFFFGQKDKLLEYQKLYHEVVYWFQNELNIADDDQHITLQCYFKNPELFTLHLHYGWHKVFVFFQKV